MQSQGTPPPPDIPRRMVSVRSSTEASALWSAGQDLAAALERKAEEEQDEAERERLGDMADALRGL